MRASRGVSIRTKLKLIIMVTSSSAVVLACAVFLFHEYFSTRTAIVRRLESLALIVAEQSSAAVAFNDARVASEILGSLSREKGIVVASISDRSGRSLARYEVPGGAPPDIEIVKPIGVEKEIIGTVILGAGLEELHAVIRMNVLVVGGALLGALLLAFSLASKLEGMLTRPILDLGSTVRLVSESKDFSVRAARRADDELGALVDGFNGMLAQIQSRDSEIVQARDLLDDRVRQRTAEFSAANKALREEIAVRQRAEEALGEARLRYRQLVQSVGAIVWRADPVGDRFTFVSHEAEKILGYPVVEWLRQPGFRTKHVHPGDGDRVHRTFAEVMQGNSTELEYRMIAADGRTVWLRDLIRPIREGNRIKEVVGVTVDITRQKEAEENLRESEERYRHLFESSPDAVMIESEGECVLLNPAAEQLFGAAGPQDLIGTSIFDRVTEDRREGVLHKMRNPGASIFEDRWIRLDGRPVEVEVTLIPFVHLSRSGSQIIIRDITRRKEMDRIKNEFISTVSHELRTPLTSIRGSLGLVTGGAVGAVPPGVRNLLDIALTNSVRLGRLIDDILDIEKVEAGKMKFNFQPVDVGALIRQSMEANRDYATQYGVRFVLEGEARGLTVCGDADRLMQVLANLLSNAAKYSPRGGEVRISVRPRAGGFRFSVADRGPGIPPEFRARVFDKFAQADSSDRRQKGGTGLGLAITKAIVERHGGAVGFDTVMGTGTTFWFDLPAREDRSVAELQEARP
jgi:PAS domain S-box-containing protein